jgi:thiamine-monophosphate kinase
MTRPSVVSGRSLELGPGIEFDRIRSIAGSLGPQAVGLGDDCALIREGEEFIALSTDISVEEVHFRLDWIGLAEMGWRATAAALSDLAAEGAEAAGVLCALTMRSAATEPEVLEVMEGVGAAARFAGAPVIGGDLSAGPSWALAITVVGRTPAPVTRGRAVPGDQIWVTGSVGGARAALEAWRRHDQPATAARARYAHPEPRIAAGRWLARHGAHAMIDLSDGLAGDAGHLAAASRVALEIDLDALPFAPEVIPEAARRTIAAQQFAAEGGEDFELLVALPASFDAAGELLHECGIPLTRIGTVVPGGGVRFLLQGRALTLKGYNHFG